MNAEGLSRHGVGDLHISIGEDAYSRLLSPQEILERMDTAGIETAVLGPMGRWAAVDNQEGNDTLLGWRERHHGRFEVWATVNAWFGARAASELRRAFDKGCIGWKIMPSTQGHGLLTPLLDPLLDIAAEFARPVYVVTGVPVVSEPLQLGELARRRPDVLFIMGRSGRTDFSLDLFPALEGNPNVLAETAYNGPGVIRDMVAKLGPGRVLFASDAPMNDIPLEVKRVRNSGLSEAELAAVLHENLAALIKRGTS